MASEPRRKKRGFRKMIVGVMATGTGERTNGWGKKRAATP